MTNLAKYMNRSLTRKEFEDRILEAADEVPLLNPRWVQSEELNRFIFAWLDLAVYYQLTSDTEIGVLVVVEYDSFIRLLRKVIYGTDTSSELADQAAEKLRELEAALARVAREAGSNALSS